MTGKPDDTQDRETTPGEKSPVLFCIGAYAASISPRGHNEHHH